MGAIYLILSLMLDDVIYTHFCVPTQRKFELSILKLENVLKLKKTSKVFKRASDLKELKQI